MKNADWICKKVWASQIREKYDLNFLEYQQKTNI